MNTPASDELSPAELRVIKLLAENGWSNGEMAEHLTLSIRTIETHISKALSKTETRNRVQLVLWVQKHL